MGTGFAKKKKQAKMMQGEFMKMQEKIKELEVEGTAGNGLVTIVLDGDNRMKKLVIKPECVDPDDIDGLQDLIKAAYGDALTKLQKESSKGMPQLPPGMGGFPGF